MTTSSRPDDGPDGSSIKPVSSLLAKFENLTKPNNDAPAADSSRSLSPGPKPERPRDAPSSNAREPPPLPRPKPKDNNRLSVAGLQSQSLGSGQQSPSSPNRPVLPPPISPRPLPPPSFTVEPPQSPPKRGGDVAVGERPAFLSTDSMVKPSSPSGPKPFKIPSRPHTPVLEPRRSPRLTASQPPSPPPPRRSAELRREREVRDTRPAPPPPAVNRAEKPLISSRHSYTPEGGGYTHTHEHRARSADKHSPFSSPPSSHGTPEEEDNIPPMLPTRPRPQQQQQQQQQDIPSRPKSVQLGFQPPPLHPSVVSWRRDREEVVNGNGAASRGGGILTPQITGEPRPALPARPQSAMFTGGGGGKKIAVVPPPAAALPPRPARPLVNTHNTSSAQNNNTNNNNNNSNDAPPGTSQKRVVSTPTTVQQFAPPPTRRTHGRSMTVDRTSNRVPPEFQIPQTPISGLTGDARTEEATTTTTTQSTTTYPDQTNVNRSFPHVHKGVHEIPTKYDSRIMDVCGDLVVTTGTYTRVWSLLDGELLMSLAMGEGIKGASVAFRPGAHVDDEGTRVWIGNNFGELMEADVATQSIVASKAQAHGRQEIIRIHRHFNELWTLDEGGTLHVWGPSSSNNNEGGGVVPSLVGNANQSFRLPKGHVFSMVVGDELWHATGKEIRVFLPTVDGRSQFQVLMRPLVQEGAGEVTAGTVMSCEPDKAFFGHNDGKVSIYSARDYACLAVVNVSAWKINSLAGVGRHLWAGYNTGKVCVYDMGAHGYGHEQTQTPSPWVVKKEWQAHENPVIKLIADPSSLYKLDRCQVVSLGADNTVRAWDGLLQEDWLEGEMKSRDHEYCDFETIKALVLTWNAGASTPNSLRYSESDASFIQDLLQSSGSPDILVFGFQELVDLEDKTATAKRLLKPKKKEGADQERMSHQYRDWRDFLVRSLDDYMAGDLYHLLHTAPMVGLFTCVFVKADLRDRVSNLSGAEVKRGMGGLHGNKGAVLVRFLVDDTSLCFINCHLAAGQGGANQRHNDVAAILEASVFPGERDPAVRVDSYVGGGDGTMVLDHELCLLNGDLNYRIDTMSRDTVVAAVKVGNLAKLLDRDQLLVARRRRPAFGLRAFEELPIAFAPTYKYDVGTDNYDSSEKKRSPAWCDRLLFRSSGGGGGRIEQLDYRRHEVRVSDHRPVSGRFRFTVKRVSPKRRAVAWMQCQQRWDDVRQAEAQRQKLYYLTQVIGYDADTAQQLIRERAARRDHRSPSRHRD